VVARKDRKAKEGKIDCFNAPKRQCSQEHVNVKCFATDGDNGYEGLHLEGLYRMLRRLPKGKFLVSQNFRIISDVLTFLKRVRRRMLPSPEICIRLSGNSPGTDINRIAGIHALILRIVWSTDIITKMHDSWPMTPFRFKSLLWLYSHGEFPRLIDMIRFILRNEAMSDTNDLVPATSET
jgi:hypothetical protein